MMRLFFAVILGVVLFGGRGMAQEEANVMTATSALQDVLSNLKQSVEKLSLDNDQLAARDNVVKQQIAQLQKQLGQIQGQGDSLNKSVATLQENNPSRAEVIARLEKENYDLDNRTQKDEVSIKSIQESLEAGYKEDQQLLLQLKTKQNVLPIPVAQPVESPTANHDQKEKLRLMKMVSDSQERQETLHESILQLQKDKSLSPAATALAYQDSLKKQIKDLEDQVASYPPEKPSSNASSTRQWDNTQLSQMEEELKSLERNYAQLKSLMGQITQRSKNNRITVSQHVEETKLLGNIDELKRQSIGLRADLEDLRSQMVDLDKRKTHLEEMIKHQQ